MVQLRTLAKENNLMGYSRLRKADLISFISETLYKNEPPNNETLVPKEQPQKEDKLGNSEVLSKRQRKRMRNKASKLSKKSKNLRIEINDLKSQKDDIEDKVKKASSSTSARFKR